jgi:hypothetical protein
MGNGAGATIDTKMIEFLQSLDEEIGTILMTGPKM